MLGGVSSWCHDLVSGLDKIDWHIVPITAGGLRRTSLYDIADHVTLTKGIELWSRPIGRRGSRRRRAPPTDQKLLPADLCRLLLGTHDDADQLVEILSKCRANPEWARGAFRSDEAWGYFLEELTVISRSDGTDLFVDVDFSSLEATELWQTLYWLAMTAATELPDSDVILITAAGWGAVMAAAEITHRAVPIVLAEHGIYVREAYLEAARSAPPPGPQFTSTRLARGLSQLAYAITDRIAPVCDSHHPWEQALGAQSEQLHTIVNGVSRPDAPSEPRHGQTATSVGRIDPLKDVIAMLRAAALVCEAHPEARFVHYGPATETNRSYYDMCQLVHADLDLGDRFVFMGSTDDQREAMRDADVYLSTSISEGLPLSLLEAMSEGRPVVSTNVGGCADAMNGCGVLVSAGDVFRIAHEIGFLLDNPEIGEIMGRRRFRRVERRFSTSSQLASYQDLFEAVAS